MQLELAVTDAFHEKQNLKGKKSAYAYDFKSVRFTLQDIIKWVTDGKSLSVGQVKGGHRHRDNFVSSQLIGIDVDSGEICSVEQLTQVPYIQQNAFFVGPTASSTPEDPRSRVFFLLDQPITNGILYSEYVKRVMAFLETQGVEPDKSCKDPVRLFHGSTVDGWWVKHDNVLAVSELEKLPSTQKKSTKYLKKNKKAVTQSTFKTLSDSDLTKLQKKIRGALPYIPKQQEYEDWLKVLMAVHDVLPNARGIALIEEWSAGKSGEVEAKFDSFETSPIDKISIKTLWYMARKNGWKDDPDALYPSNVVCVKYITDAKLFIGKTCLIKSAMGTGKTELMKRYIQKLNQEMLDKHGRYARIGILSHRVSLVENLCERLGFESYLNLDAADLRRHHKIVCTVNSIQKLTSEQEGLPYYDLIIIDEIEQVLSHLKGNATLKGNAGPLAFAIISKLIANADQVIGLDAHIRYPSYKFLQDLRGEPQLIENTFQPNRGTLNVMNDEDELATHFIEHAKRATKPLVFLSDQKSKIEAVHKLLTGKYGLYNSVAIHSDNSSSPAIQAFIRNIDKSLAETSILLFSPTIGTGVDIQTDVEAVYACFHGMTISATQMHQMLGRCRQAKQFYVHIKKVNHDLPTDEGKIYDTHYKAMRDTGQLLNIDIDGRVTPHDLQRDYLKFQSFMDAHRNKEMNNYYATFMELAHEEYVVQPFTTGIKGVGKELKELQKELSDHLIALALGAEPVNYEEYNEFKDRGELTDEVKAGFLRWNIEDTYSRTISTGLIDKWKNGDGRKQLMQFRDIYLPRSEMIARDRKEEECGFAWKKERSHYTKRQQILHEAIAIIWGSMLHCDDIPQAVLEQKLEGPFKEMMEKYWRNIKLLFRHRGEKDPYLVLRCLLRRIGLKANYVPVGKSRDTKVFRLDPESLMEMQEFATNWCSRHGIDFYISQNVFETNAETEKN